MSVKKLNGAVSPGIKVRTSQKHEEGDVFPEFPRTEVPMTLLRAVSWQQPGWKKVSGGKRKEWRMSVGHSFEMLA